MTSLYVTVMIITIAANGVIGAADLVPAKFVLNNSAAVAVPRTWLPTLGLLKLAGAIGLLAGLLGLRPIGIAAAIGLILFFVGAVITHIRARAFATLPAPGLYLVLATATLVLQALPHF